MTAPPFSGDDTAPIEVQNDKDSRCVRVKWASGHVSQYPFDYLRGYCPCAVCQGHGAGMKKYVTPPPHLRLEGIKQVGLYALQFVWSDGHSTGLYRYEYLREMCPDCIRTEGSV